MSDTSQGGGWWRASDDKWYPPETHPEATLVVTETISVATAAPSTPVLPMAPIVDKRTYASPLSYTGATRRTFKWVKVAGDTPVKAGLAWSAAVLWLLLMYSFLMLWYVMVFGFFGLFTVPYRIIRRSNRRSHHLQETQLATMQAMMIQQQTTLSRTESPTTPAPPI